MGTGAIAISLPFACVLGLLASTTASTMGTDANITLRISSLFKILIPKIFPLVISYLNRISYCSEKQIHMGLCIDSVCPGGSLRPCVLLLGKSVSNNRNYTTTKLESFWAYCRIFCLADPSSSSAIGTICNICRFRHGDEWEFDSGRVPKMEKDMEQQSLFVSVTYLSSSHPARSVTENCNPIASRPVTEPTG